MSQNACKNVLKISQDLKAEEQAAALLDEMEKLVEDVGLDVGKAHGKLALGAAVAEQ